MTKLVRESKITLASPKLETHDPEKRSFMAVANNSNIVDCYQAINLAVAWEDDLHEFLQNPIGLWMHNMNLCGEPRPPIFAPMDTQVDKDLGLTFWPTWQPPGSDKFADMIYQKYTGKPRLLRAFSVGWLPLRWVNRDQLETITREEEKHLDLVVQAFEEHPSARRVYTRNRLDEISGVDLPGNKGSLARSALGQVRLDPAIVKVIESLGFQRLPVDDVENSTGAQETLLSIDEVLETMDLFSLRLAETSRTELAANELLLVREIVGRLGAISADPEDVKTDPELEELASRAAEKLESMNSAVEDILGQVVEFASTFEKE